MRPLLNFIFFVCCVVGLIFCFLFLFIFCLFVCLLFVCLFVWLFFFGEGRYKCKILKLQLWMLYYWAYRLMWEQRTITLVEIGVWHPIHSRTHRRYNTKLAKLVVLVFFYRVVLNYETKSKRNERNETKRNETKRNETKRNETKY
jgi:hypothetical protein